MKEGSLFVLLVCHFEISQIMAPMVMSWFGWKALNE
jgi:hypothetical protein